MTFSSAPPGQKPGGTLQFSYVDAGIHPVDEPVPVHHHAFADSFIDPRKRVRYNRKIKYTVSWRGER